MKSETRTAETERGMCHVVTYLYGVTDAEIEKVMDGIADLLVELGLSCENDDDGVRSLVGLKALPFPLLDDEDATKAFLDEHSRFYIPTKGGA